MAMGPTTGRRRSIHVRSLPSRRVAPNRSKPAILGTSARGTTMNRALAALAVVSFAGVLAAQPAVRALPRVCTDAYGGSTGFATPTSSFRAQYWYSGDNLPLGWPIFDLGIRLRANASAPPSTRVIEIMHQYKAFQVDKGCCRYMCKPFCGTPRDPGATMSWQ